MNLTTHPMRALLRFPTCDEAHGWTRVEQTSTADGVPAVALLSPELDAPDAFTEAIPTWRARTPDESWIEIELRVRRNNRWSRFYRVARWDDRLEQSGRRSFDSQRDEDARVAVDTLAASAPCEAIQARVLLCGAPTPHVEGFTLALSAQLEHASAHTVPEAAPEIAVPLRSQMVYPNGGNTWCSPTSVVMLIGYWHAHTGDERLAPYLAHEAVPERAVPLCYDPAYEGTGNWIFNMAFAAQLGLDAYIARFTRLADLVPWLAAGVPMILSVAWGTGELEHAPIASSDGHLLVVTGFDGAGSVFVADPAGKDASQVRRRYDARQLEAAWLNNSQGTVYVIHPPQWPIPGWKVG